MSERAMIEVNDKNDVTFVYVEGAKLTFRLEYPDGRAVEHAAEKWPVTPENRS